MNNMKRFTQNGVMLGTACLLAMLLLEGCTSVKVRPVDSNLGVSHIYIQKNNEVAVSDFLTVLINGCSRNGIGTTVVTGDFKPSEKDFTLQYTANRSWDFVMYLTSAEIDIYQNKRQVGYAEYHLVGDGGLSLFKWQGTEAKIGPVIDELLQNYQKTK
jgi:hypothetical protein